MKKKEEERTKLIFLRFDFATLTKVSKTLRVVLHLNSIGLLVHKLSSRLNEHFRVTAPIMECCSTP